MRLLRLPGVFQPISDSWMLGGALRREPIGPGTSVLDLCTGSGMLATLAGLCGAREVVAVDVSRRALVSAVLNGALTGVRAHPARGDLFGAVPGRRFEIIVSNPPYVPGPQERLPDRGPERAWDAGSRGRAFLDRICREAPVHLTPGGVLLIVHSVVCDEAKTLSALRARGLETGVVLRHVGRLGPRLREREEWLRHSGLLAGQHDEVIVVRAQAPEAYPITPRTGRAA